MFRLRFVVHSVRIESIAMNEDRRDAHAHRERDVVAETSSDLYMRRAF
jgi:hypothetical protein